MDESRSTMEAKTAQHLGRHRMREEAPQEQEGGETEEKEEDEEKEDLVDKEVVSTES